MVETFRFSQPPAVRSSPAVVFCQRSGFQGISGSLSTSSQGRAFSSWWRMWSPTWSPASLIWGTCWKGPMLDGKDVRHCPCQRSERMPPSLHLGNDGTCWMASKALLVLLFCHQNPEGHQGCQPPECGLSWRQERLRPSSEIFVNEPRHLYSRKKSNP